MTKYIYIIFFYIFLTINSSAQSNQWEVLGNMPHPVSGGRAIALDSVIVILGGDFDSLGMQVNFIQTYNPYSDSWALASQLVESRSGFVADIYSDSVIVSCGGIWNPTINLFSIEMWDLTNPVWGVSQIYNHNINFGRVNCTGHIYNDDLYIIGGLATPVLGDSLLLPYIAKYNIPTASIVDSFTTTYTLGDLPWHQMSAMIDQDIYIFGGAHFSVNNEIYKFSVNTNNYQLKNNLLGNRAAGAAVVDNELIYIIGGYDESRNALNTVELFNSNSDSVWAGPTLNLERSELMAAKFENSIYVFGGKNDFYGPVTAVEKLDLITSLDIPKPIISGSFRLGQNYPNPFNGTTKIVFELNKNSKISLDIYTINGEHINNIVQQILSSGEHEYLWDGKDNNHQDLASGVYIYQLQNSEITLSQKMILLR